MSSWQDLLSTEAKGQSAEQTMKHRAEIPKAPHKHSLTYASQAREFINWLVSVSELTCQFKRLIKYVMPP